MGSAVICGAEEGERLDVLGGLVRILVDGAASGGQYAIFEQVTAPGVGPPLHRHGRDDEWFYVIEGSVKFSVEGRESVVKAGGFVFAPKGSAHTFVSLGPGNSTMLIGCRPAGLEGPFREVDRMKRAGPLDMGAVVEAFRKAEIEFIGPPLSS